MIRILLALLASLVFVPSAHAQSDAEFTRAIHDGEAELEAHHYPEARALFRHALTLSPDSRPLVRLGQTEFEMRAYVDCVVHLRAALADTIHPIHGARDQVTALLGRARVFVGEYRLTLDPPDASVTLDDAPVAPGTPLLTAIGTHTIVVRAAGREDLRRTIETAGGEDETLTLSLPATGLMIQTTTPGDAAPRVDVVDTAPPGPRVRLHVTATRPGLTAHDDFTLLCAAPCDAELAAGNHTLRVGDGGGAPILADHSVYTFDADSAVELDYDNRGDIRTAGAVIFFAGFFGSLIPILAGLVSAPSLGDLSDGSVAAIGVGIGMAVLSITLGPALAFLQDHAEIRAR